MVTSEETRAGIDYKRIADLINAGLAAYYVYEPDQRTFKQLFWRDQMETPAGGAVTTNKWNPWYGTGAVAYINNAIGAFEGDYVLRMQDTAAQEFGASVNFGCLKKQILAVEYRWWKHSQIQYGGWVKLERVSRTMAEALRGIIRWNSNRGGGLGAGWQYMDDTGNYANLIGAEEIIYNNSWNYVRLVIDFENGIYKQLKSNLVDIDLSSYAIRQFTSGNQGQLELSIGFRVSGALPVACYLDDCRLYLNWQ